ncbi:MAG TPA: aldo/keto reductase, partial [Candidatus Binatia bacterium]|nr:aldo/keto reductase [Candidatus Binatia bacterium]
KVRYVGVSNFKAWQLMKALALSDNYGWSRPIAAQYQHSLVVRDIEPEFVELFLGEGVGSVPWGPLGGGFLSGKYRSEERPEEGRLSTTPQEHEESWHRRAVDRNWEILQVVGEISERRQKSYAQIALNWLLSRQEVSSVIIGARTLDQLDDNLGAVGWELSADELGMLDDVSAPDWGYPYRMIMAQGAR